MKPWLPKILGISFFSGGLSTIAIGISQLNKWLVDTATGHSPAFDMRIFLILCLATFANMAVNSGLNTYQTLLYEKQSYQMRKQFFRQVLIGDWQRLSAFHSGDIMTRITSDVDMIAHGVFTLIPQVVSVLCQFITAFLLFYHYAPGLSIVILGISPFGLLFSIILSRVYSRLQKQSRENEAEYRAFMQESTENLMLAKCFSLEVFFQEKLEFFWNKRYAVVKKRTYTSFFLNILMTLVFSGSYLIAFGWSTLLLSKGEITYGTLTLLLTLISRVQSPIQSLQGMIQQMVNLIVSAGRIMEISQLPSELYLDHETESKKITGPLGIRINHITFAYDNDHRGVLNDLDLEIRPGETVGIIGGSGEGKTTLLRLFLALAKPQSGNLCIYNELGVKEEIGIDTRKYFNFVPQGNTLMSGSVRDNLLLGNQQATDDDLWRALAIAEASEFVKKLPDALDHRISEKGGTISEGQAQRIAIARALVKSGEILILDEATSSLDIETESQIIKNLKLMVKNKTCIIITHRLSLLDICETIYKIQDGQIKQEGKKTGGKQRDVEPEQRVSFSAVSVPVDDGTGN